MHRLGQNSSEHRGMINTTVHRILFMHKFYTYFKYRCLSGDKREQSPFDRRETDEDQVACSKSKRQNYPQLKHMKSEWLY